MLAVTSSDIRLFLHILAAAIWVGGQIVLGALVPAIRGFDGATKAAANRFAVVAWPAFAVLLVTGIWNMQAVDLSDEAQMTLNVKLVFVVISGVSAFVHSQAKSKPLIGATGGLGALSALAALFFGVQLG
ncbi:hypothetical protein GCM10027589_19470 [Actinocorallia lasiicapitis]